MKNRVDNAHRRWNVDQGREEGVMQLEPLPAIYRLSTEPELFQSALSVTTDFRRVLSEYLHTRGQHTTQSREFVFPGYTGYSPMGVFKSLPDPDDLIMSDGFE